MDTKEMRQMQASYLSVNGPGEIEIIEKKSRFIGSCTRVYDEADFEEFLDSVKTKYPRARHYCTAWVLGENGLYKRYDDDGEPQGTGGPPILRVLETAGVTNTAVVVTRYFGGVLLGTGGLARTYASAAQLALDAAHIVRRSPFVALRFELSYEHLGAVQHRIETDRLETLDISYEDSVRLTVAVKEGTEEPFIAFLQEATSGHVLPVPVERVWRSLPPDSP